MVKFLKKEEYIMMKIRICEYDTPEIDEICYFSLQAGRKTNLGSWLAQARKAFIQQRILIFTIDLGIRIFLNICMEWLFVEKETWTMESKKWKEGKSLK